MKGSKRKFEDSRGDSATTCKLQKLSNEGEISGSRSSHNVDEPSSYRKESSNSSFRIINEEESTFETTSDEEKEIASRCSNEILLVTSGIGIPENDSQSIVKTISNDLKRALGKLHMPYNILPFGSFVNGLASRGSDLDFFLKTFSKCERSNQINQLMRQAANQLRRSKLFRYKCMIPTARVPIIKFTHSLFKYECDLAFANEIGVRNTLLVRFYLGLNETLKPLVLFLKYLLGLYDLHGTQKITTYMLFWLVVYYMQQQDILPPVRTVRESVSESYIVNGWDSRVPDPFKVPVNDSLPLFSHLKAFLKFYAEINFLNFVISPYLACPLSVNDFESLRIPFDRFAEYFHKVQNVEDTTFNFSFINLQDPTELNVNITRQVELPALNMFRSFCYHVRNLFTDNISTKLASNQEFTKLLPKTIPKNFCDLPGECIQYEIHRLTANKLPENHPARKTFSVNGVLFFAKQLEKIIASKYDSDVQTVISDQTLRINKKNKGDLRQKMVPVAYFRCSLREDYEVDGKQSDEIESSERRGFKSDLFILMDTTFGGDEIRIRFESQVGFLRSSSIDIINSLIETPE